jgi:hypothetical protein
MTSAADQIKQYSYLTQSAIRSAAARAINRAATTTRAEVARKIKDDLGLNIGVIKAAIDLDTASARDDLSTMKATLTASGKGVPLYQFSPLDRRVNTPRGQRMGVTVRVKGQRKLVAHAFIAETRGGHVGIFVRKGRGRFPVKELYSTTVAEAFTNRMADFKEIAQAYMEANLASELHYQLMKVAT